jgi:cytochrome c553
MPAVSESQQRLMGMVHAYKKGKLKKAPKKIKEIAKHISDDDARDFAKTKHKGLPDHVKKAASFLEIEMFIRGYIDRMRGQ